MPASCDDVGEDPSIHSQSSLRFVYPVRATLPCAAPRDSQLAPPMRTPSRTDLHQAECGGLSEIAAFVIVEQQHRHHHGVAGVEKQRRAEFADRQHEQQRHRGDHARPRQRQHDRPDGAEHALAADPGRLLEFAMDLQERGRQRLDRIRHEARDERQRQNPDRAVETAGNADPCPQIGDADHEAGDRDRHGRNQIDPAPARHLGAVNGVADGKGQRAADHGGDDRRPRPRCRSSAWSADCRRCCKSASANIA